MPVELPTNLKDNAGNPVRPVYALLIDAAGNFVNAAAGGGGGGGNGDASEATLLLVKTATQDTAEALGDPADAAWSGTGSGAAIALLKALHAQLATPATALPPAPPVASANTDLTRGAAVSIAAATDTTLVAATASQSTRLHRIALTIAAAQTLTFKRGSTVLAAFDFPATGGSLVLEYSPYWWFKTANNEALVLTTSTAAAVKGLFDYVKGA